MDEVITALYISIATYYQIGIIHCYKKVVNNDRNLRVFFRKCPLAILVACFLILCVAYCWPVIALSRLFFDRWVKENLHPPIAKFDNLEDPKLF